MRYYSEDTVRNIIKIMAHSFLEEGKTFADTLLKNQPSVVIRKPHGRSIDADKLKDTIVRCINDAEKEFPKEDFGLVKMVYESCLYQITNAPTIIEASNEQRR